MNDVCLVIIYNHNYEKNVAVLDRIYAGRFSHVYHVMPFYRGDAKNVIGVYESSYQFNGYIAQAAQRLSGEYGHYVFVADDMVLNPELNEANIISTMGLSRDDGFVSSCHVFSDEHMFSWPQGRSGIMYQNATGNATEWRRFMPSIVDARKSFDRCHLNWRDGASTKLYNILRCGLRAMRKDPWFHALFPPLGLTRHFYKNLVKDRENLPLDTNRLLYPTAWGYSDFVVVPADCMVCFCHYCGVFAAMNHFVEAAIPTSLVLSCNKVKTLRDIGWKAENGVDDYKVRKRLERESSFDYQKFVCAFPAEYLYVHPVKLSKWKNLP